MPSPPKKLLATALLAGVETAMRVMALTVLSKPELPVMPTTMLLGGLQLMVTGIFVAVDALELRYTEMDWELEQEV